MAVRTSPSSYDHVVVGVGAVPRTFPIPGLTEHAIGCSTILDALYLRNQLLRPLAAAALNLTPNGVAATSRSSSSAEATPAWRLWPSFAISPRTPCAITQPCVDVPQRWVLVDAAPEDPG